MTFDDNLCRRVTFIRVRDGDTFVADMWMAPPVRPKPKLEIAIRVHGWSAQELREEDGPYFRDRFQELLTAATTIVVRMKSMNFDRIVAAVYLDDVLFAGILRRELRQRMTARASL